MTRCNGFAIPTAGLVTVAELLFQEPQAIHSMGASSGWAVAMAFSYHCRASRGTMLALPCPKVVHRIWRRVIMPGSNGFIPPAAGLPDVAPVQFQDPEVKTGRLLQPRDGLLFSGFARTIG